MFFYFQHIKSKLESSCQKGAASLRGDTWIEDVVLGMQALDEELVTQSSMSQQLFLVNMEIERDEVGVAQVE